MSEIFERAALVTPIGGLFKADDAFGGAYSHTDYPMFAAKASGSRIIGVDGSEYIDLVCGGGVCTLGYATAAVDDEVKKRIDMGDYVTLVDESYITLAETVVRTLRSADWATFCSDGHQAVTMAIMAARYYTQRKKLLFFKDSFGGVVPVLARADDGRKVRSMVGVDGSGNGDYMEFCTPEHGLVGSKIDRCFCDLIVADFFSGIDARSV